MTTPTPPSAMDFVQNVHVLSCACNSHSYLTPCEECAEFRKEIARTLSERDEQYQRTDEARMQAIQYQGFLNAQLRERERELRDTTTALAAAHHELERTDQVRADLAEREQEAERLREELTGICSLVESRQARIDHLEQSENEYRHALERWFTIQNKQDVDQWTTKTKALLTRHPAPDA